ncbi:MAG: NADH-quinone oxidoreductase subunit C [Porphyromonadaceae bacterium]|nr:MAG: NADH-quinone oxidoreductase subunit C [Porphyromonadaceae bacterium]
MEKEQLGQVLSELFPSLEINTSQDPVRVKADTGSIHSLAMTLRDDSRFQFDYLFNMYGIDREDRFTLVYYLESTIFRHIVAIETDLADHDNPVVESISDLWKTAEFQEREIYDLMGVSFTNHPDPRRLFLEDGWAFPLRKDYKDDINFIER